MSEIASAARARAAKFLEHEARIEELDLTVEETFSEIEMKEIRQAMFEEIQQVVSGVSNDLLIDGWETEVEIDPDGEKMVLVLKEGDDNFFTITYSVNQHGEDKRDGIEPSNLSFDLNGARFDVTITSSVNERMFGGIGSYRGVLRVTKEEIVDTYLDRYFINLLRQSQGEF